ncbi:MAG: 1-deoxy-D-xylulose-5-phosphate reductoisomerase, partial [Evtepia sp.]
PCLALAIQAAKTGGTAPVVLNGANEIAVTRFLKGDIGFMDIPRLVAHTLKRMPVIANPTLADIHSADLEAREIAASKSAI